MALTIKRVSFVCYWGVCRLENMALTIKYVVCKSLGNMKAQQLEVLSLNHPYSLKTNSSQCHYVVMIRSETKFQAPLNCRYQEVLAKTEHLTIKTMSTGHARHG